jgi:hypothetical protein
MKLEIIRNTFTDESTIGGLLINGDFAYNTLELPWNDGANIHEKNCILPGTYELIITHSPHLGYDTPILLNVPNRNDIRIHIANYPKDILGCIGIGLTKGEDFIGKSKAAFDDFMPKLIDALKADKVFIKIWGN